MNAVQNLFENSWNVLNLVNSSDISPGTIARNTTSGMFMFLQIAMCIFSLDSYRSDANQLELLSYFFLGKI